MKKAIAVQQGFIDLTVNLFIQGFHLPECANGKLVISFCYIMYYIRIILPVITGIEECLPSGHQ